MTTLPTNDLTAIGILASDLRVTVREIERAADQIGVAPALMLNRIAHFDGDQVAAIVQFLRSQRVSGDTIAHLANNLHF
jgi:hypothetical protein